MKVIVRSGARKGLTGNIRGDLNERRATLGKDGKVLVRDTGLKPPNDMLWIKTKHLDSDINLFSNKG